MNIDLRLLQDKNSAFTEFGIKEGDFLLENDAALRVKTGIIYLIVNLVNGKVYVGLSRQTFRDRYRCNWVKWTDNDHLKKAVAKYGRKSFYILIMEENRGLNILNILETYYILKFKSNESKYGYNKTSGGDNNYILSEDSLNKMRYTKKEFVDLAIKKHGDKYNYDSVEYKTGLIKTKIFCNKCKDFFYQTPSSHLAGKGCRKCGLRNMGEKNLISFEEFQEKSRKKFGDEYTFYKNSYTRFHDGIVSGKHNKCGTEFTNNPNLLLRGSILCPVCYKQYCIEKGSRLRSYVNSKNISKWKLEKSFKEVILKTKELFGDKIICLGYSTCLANNGRNKIVIKQKCNICDNEFNRYKNNIEKECEYCKNKQEREVSYSKSST